MDALECRYEGPMVGIACWFVVDPQKRVRYLNEGLGLLVGAGDYDCDGKSELVFQLGGYNRGGYVIYYDDFNKRAVFEFGYH